MSRLLYAHASKRDLLIFLYKHRRRLVFAFALPFLLFFAISFIPTPRYAAQSVLIVRLGSEYVYQPDGGNTAINPSPAIPFNEEQIFKSEVAILGSEDLHAQVIEAVGLEKLFPNLVHPTGLAFIVAYAHSAIDAAMISAGLAEPLTPAQAQAHLLAKAQELFDKRLDILLEKESAVINISYEHADASIAAETLEKLIALYFEKRKALYLDPRAKVAEAEVQAQHERALAAEHAVADYKRRHKIYSLDDQRSDLLKRRADAQDRAAVISAPSLRARIRTYNHELDMLDAEEREFNSLQKEAQIADDSYSIYSHKLDEAKAYEDIQHERIGGVRVIQAPSVPAEPMRLQFLIILAGSFVSLLIMLGMAALSEYSQTGFLTPEDIERTLGLPVLAIFPDRKQG